MEKIPTARVSLPLDFGVHLFNNKAYSDISIQLSNGDKVWANSVILSLNSPVLEDLISNLPTGIERKQLQIEDFDNDVTTRFIQSFYSGKLGTVDKALLDEMHKIALYYNVKWIKEKFLAFFTILAESMWTFEDCDYLLTKIEQAKMNSEDGFRNILTGRFTTSNQDHSSDAIFGQILDGFKTLSSARLDFLIDVANKSFNQKETSYLLVVRHYSNTLVVKMTDHIKESGKKLKKLDTNCRAVLENLNLGNKEKPVNTLPFFNRTPPGWAHQSHGYIYNSNTGMHELPTTDPQYSGDTSAVSSFKENSSTLFQHLMDLKDLSHDDMRMVMKLFMSL